MNSHFKNCLDGVGKDGKWLLDSKLDTVWKRFDKWHSAVIKGEDDFDLMEYAAAKIVGGLTTPSWLLDGKKKKKLRDGANKSHKLLVKAAEHLYKAADAISAARAASNWVPSAAISYLHLVPLPDNVELTSREYLHEDSETDNLLEKLAEAIGEPPDFSEVTGLVSQKCGWRDWFREAHINMERAEEKFDTKIGLEELDWLNLAKAYAGDFVTKGMVHNALWEMKDFYREPVKNQLPFQ